MVKQTVNNSKQQAKQAKNKRNKQKPSQFKRKLSPKQEDDVARMVADGLTYREVMAKYKQVKSLGTISKIVNRNAKKISKRRDRYVRLLDRVGATDLRTAKKIADLLDAGRVTAKGDVTPDNRIQLDTVRYINELKGRSPQGISGQSIGVRGDNVEVVISDYKSH